VMLVGAAGTGKTVLINDRVSSLAEDDYMVANIPFNFYTTSEMLQHIMEQPLEKKAGRNYGPPGTKNLVYFVDDMNMPEVLSRHPSCVRRFYSMYTTIDWLVLSPQDQERYEVL